MADDTFNAFLLIPELALDEHDEAVIKAAIKKMRGRWSRDRNKPKRSVQNAAKLNLSRLPEIEARLLNAETRAREAKDARKRIKVAQEESRSNFERDVTLLSKGTVTDQAVKQLARRYETAHFTEADIRALLATLVQPKGQPLPTRGTQAVDASTVQDIEASLDVLKEASLYTFLKVRPTAPLRDVNRAIAAMEEDLKGQRITREKEASDNLLGKCRTLFKDDAARARYDYTLELEQVRPFLEMVSTCCDSGSVTVGHVLMLLKEAAKLSPPLDTPQALAHINDRAAERSVLVRVDQQFDFQRSIVCSCGQKNAPLTETCSSCGQPLYAACLKCQNASPVDSLSCSCGYSLENAHARFREAVLHGATDEAQELWQDEYRSHPAFREIIAEYDALVAQNAGVLRRKQQRQDALARLERAVRDGDATAVRRLWKSDFADDLKRARRNHLLRKVRDAHKPADVQGVRARHRGEYIEVTWQTTNRHKWYTVSYAHDGPVTHPSAGTARRVTLGEYNRIGFKIKSPSSRDYYLTVFAGSTFMGDDLLSTGRSTESRALVKAPVHRAEVRYSIKSRGFSRWRKGILTLSVRDMAWDVPPLVLVAKLGSVFPLERSDAQEVLRIMPVTLSPSTPYVKEFDISRFPSPTQFALFTAQTADDALVDLMPLSTLI